MNLTELLQKLSYGPLAELSVAGEGTGIVPPANVPRLIIPINAVLSKLYARFGLQKRTLILETVDGVYAYTLTAPYAQLSGSDEINKYIKDTAGNPFLDDVLQVTDILGNQANLPVDPDYISRPALEDNDYIPLPLNDRNDPLSWHVLSYDTLGMDYPKTGDRYFIQYKAKHAVLPLQPVDATQVQIRIPDQLEQALLSGVAELVYRGMSMEMALSKSQLHGAAYEAECVRLEMMDAFNQFDSETNLKPLLNGWV